MDDQELISRFTYHKAVSPEQVNRYATIRNMGLDLAMTIKDWVPEGREKALAITKLEETVMWANAGIARHWKENDHEPE